jgi:hypothetical protein
MGSCCRSRSDSLYQLKCRTCGSEPARDSVGSANINVDWFIAIASRLAPTSFLPFSDLINKHWAYPPGDLAFGGFGSTPGIGWSLGGLGISIGGSNGGPLPGLGVGTPLGVTGGYGIGVGVPGEPGMLGGLTGIVGCWACTQLIESAARAMAVRMVRFINGSVAIVCLQASPYRAALPFLCMRHP